MLDKISYKILIELCKFGRISNAQLSRTLGLNPSTVRKRTNEMLENDVLRIVAIPNPEKMGYKANLLIFLNVDPMEINNVCNKFIGNPHVNLVASVFGRFDIMLVANFHEVDVVDEFLKSDLHPLKGLIHIQMYLVSKFRKIQIHEEIFKDDTATGDAVIDETDERIIRRLMQNGRENYADIAEDLGMSVSSVSKRVDAMTKDSIIRIIGVPNPTKFGYTVDAFILLRCDFDKIEKICNQLLEFHEIYMTLALMNDYNIFFGILSPDPGSLYQFLQNNIYPIDGVQYVETLIRGNYLHFSPDAIFDRK